jgi:hypothetical protein
MTLLIDTSEVKYGEATTTILSLLDYVNRDEWFSNNSDCAPEVVAQHLLTKHFDILRTFVPSLADLGEVEYLHRDWSRLLSIVEESRYEWNSPPWRTVLGRAMSDLQMSQMYGARVTALVGPPIWPFVGCDKVINPIIADRNALALSIPPDYRQAAWILLCDADAFLHDALMWTIQSIAVSMGNPYEPLLAMYREQIFPLGFSEQGSFVVFLG